jgi:hypothetical protein
VPTMDSFHDVNSRPRRLDPTSFSSSISETRCYVKQSASDELVTRRSLPSRISGSVSSGRRQLPNNPMKGVPFCTSGPRPWQLWKGFQFQPRRKVMRTTEFSQCQRGRTW